MQGARAFPWIEQALEGASCARPRRVLSVGCGTCEEGEALVQALGGPQALQLVGVDLDETAIEEARRRLPIGTFLCADAARLPTRWRGSFDLVLVRRPDLLAQPQRWREVLAALPGLLGPGGQLILTFAGHAEARVARHWLLDVGLKVLRERALETPEEPWLLVARMSPPEKTQPADREAAVLVWEDGGGPLCDWETGLCAISEEGRGTHGSG